MATICLTAYGNLIWTDDVWTSHILFVWLKRIYHYYNIPGNIIEYLNITHTNIENPWDLNQTNKVARVGVDSFDSNFIRNNNMESPRETYEKEEYSKIEEELPRKCL